MLLKGLRHFVVRIAQFIQIALKGAFHPFDRQITGLEKQRDYADLVDIGADFVERVSWNCLLPQQMNEKRRRSSGKPVAGKALLRKKDQGGKRYIDAMGAVP